MFVHSSVDKQNMTKSKSTEPKLEEVLRDKAVEIEHDLRKGLDKSVAFVRENPLLTLLGAFAVGYIVAKATSRKRS